MLQYIKIVLFSFFTISLMGQSQEKEIKVFYASFLNEEIDKNLQKFKENNIPVEGISEENRINDLNKLNHLIKNDKIQGYESRDYVLYRMAGYNILFCLNRNKKEENKKGIITYEKGKLFVLNSKAEVVLDFKIHHTVTSKIIRVNSDNTVDIQLGKNIRLE